LIFLLLVSIIFAILAKLDASYAYIMTRLQIDYIRESMVWKPNVTVAAVLEDNGKFLFVHENSDSGPVLNQPAGHLEDNESLLDAAQREILEETAYEFTPEYLIGIYQYRLPAGNTTYLRFCFTGQITGQRESALDPDIIQIMWLSRQELKDQDISLRSPLVNLSLDDYERGQRLPLDIIQTIT